MVRGLALFCLGVSLYAYQWPVPNGDWDVGFLGGNGKTSAVSLGVEFDNANEAVFFADGEIIYRENAEHPLSLPTGREHLLVLQHQNWLVSYRVSGMDIEGFSEQKIPKVTEGEVLARKSQQQESAKVRVEFYDYTNDLIVSPWLMLPEREGGGPPFALLAVVPKKSFETKLRPESYLYPDDYILSYSGSKVPLRAQFYYDQQKIGDLDLSTVEQRGGQLYTNSGLTRIEDLQRGKDLEFAQLQVSGPLRQWHVLRMDVYFNELRAESQQYRVFVLPPKS